MKMLVFSILNCQNDLFHYYFNYIYNEMKLFQSYLLYQAGAMCNTKLDLMLCGLCVCARVAAVVSRRTSTLTTGCPVTCCLAHLTGDFIMGVGIVNRVARCHIRA